MFGAADILEKIKAETFSGLANFLPANTNRNPGIGVCRCEQKAIPWKPSCPDHRRCQWETSGAMERKQRELSSVSPSGAAWRERQGLRAAPTVHACAVCGSSFSSARRYKKFGRAFGPKKFGQNAAAFAKDRRAFAGCRG